MHTQTTTATIEIQRQRDGGVWFCHRLRLKRHVGRWHSDLYILQWMLKIAWPIPTGRPTTLLFHQQSRRTGERRLIPWDVGLPVSVGIALALPFPIDARHASVETKGAAARS